MDIKIFSKCSSFTLLKLSRQVGYKYADHSYYRPNKLIMCIYRIKLIKVVNDILLNEVERLSDSSRIFYKFNLNLNELLSANGFRKNRVVFMS